LQVTSSKAAEAIRLVKRGGEGKEIKGQDNGDRPKLTKLVDQREASDDEDKGSQ
jgi:hypothetical protein